MCTNKYKVIIFSLSLLFLVFSCGFNPFTGNGTIADTEKPHIRITSPITNTAVGETFTISGSCTDNVKPDRLRIIIDGNEYDDIKAPKTINILFDSSLLEDGPHRFEFVLSDKAGNEDTVTINLYIDKSAPVFSLFSPHIESGVSKTLYESFDLIGSITDTGSGLDINHSTANRLVIHKKGDESAVLRSYNLTGGNFVYDGINITSAMEGAFIIKIKARDLAGNETDYSEEVFLSSVENTPVLVVESPEPDAIPSVTTDRRLYLQGYAVDNSAIDRIEYNFLNDSLTSLLPDYIVYDTNYAFNILIDLETLGIIDGSYWLTIRAVDNEGIFSSEKRIRFHRDSSNPSIVFRDSESLIIGSTPLPYTHHNSDFNIEVSCSQSGAVIEYMMEQDENNSGWLLIQNPTTADSPYTRLIDISAIKNDYGFSDGQVKFYIRAYPSGLPDSASYSVRVLYIDETPPLLSITSHSEMQIVNGGFVLSGIASDGVALDNSIDIYNPVPGIESWVSIPSGSSWSYIVAYENDESAIETLFGLTGTDTEDVVFQVRVRDRAGNQTIDTVTVTVSPASDYPYINRYMPANTDFYASGVLSVYFRIYDDDYPRENLFARFEIEDNAGVIAEYTTDFDKNSAGFPNCLKTIDLTALENGRSYTVRISGHDFRSKEAVINEFSFTVDHTAPVISITNPVLLTGTYMSNQIVISGSITDNTLLNNAALYYPDINGNIVNRNLVLTGPVMTNGNAVYQFNCVLNSGALDTGIGGGNLNWGDDHFGNSERVFQIRTTDQSGLVSTGSVLINLDNHIPSVTVISQDDPGVFGYQSDGFYDIRGGINDTPANGIGYQLDFKALKIELYKDGVLELVIKPYGLNSAAGDTVSGDSRDFIYRWKYDQSLANGSGYVIKVYCKDNAGNETIMPATVRLIKSASPPIVTDIHYDQRNYYSNPFIVAMDVNAPEGVDYIALIANDVTIDIIEYNHLTDFVLNDEILSLDIGGLITGNTYVFKLSATDGNGVCMSYNLGEFLIDRVAPVIGASITYKTKGFSGVVTAYSAYLGFEGVAITDNISLENSKVYYRIGTSSGSNNIVDDTEINIYSWTSIKSMTISLTDFADLSGVTGTLYITIKAIDNAGNFAERVFSINRAADIDSLFTASLNNGEYLSDSSDGATDGLITISGTVNTLCSNLFISIDGQDEVTISDYSTGDTTFEHSIPYGQMPNGSHTILIHGVKNSNGTQKVVRYNIVVDNYAPLVTINPVSGTVTGMVTFTGIYNDNNADRLSLESGAGLTVTIQGQPPHVLTDGEIVRNYSGVNWTWQYTYNAGSLSGNYLVTVTAEDVAGNVSESSITMVCD